MNGARFFRLRHPSGFDEQSIDAVLRGYRLWRTWADKKIALWNTKVDPRPTYRFSEPVVSEDKKMISVSIEGEAGSYDALKFFEDGVPQPLYALLPSQVLIAVEVAFETPDSAPLHWCKARSQ